jgi:hypothetical protein
LHESKAIASEVGEYVDFARQERDGTIGLLAH